MVIPCPYPFHDKWNTTGPRQKQWLVWLAGGCGCGTVCVCVCVVAVGGSGDGWRGDWNKIGFQPLQLSRLSLLVLRLTPGSTLQPMDQGDVCGCVCACIPNPKRYCMSILGTEKWLQTQKASCTVLRPLRYGADPRHEVISLALAAFVLLLDWQEGWLSKTIVGSVTAMGVAQDTADLKSKHLWM